jgi:uncharacterized protein YuzE
MRETMTMPDIGPVLDLKVHYFADTDTLVLTTDQPRAYGETVGKDLVAFTNDDGDVVGVTLEHAAELLRPYLFPEHPARPPSIKLKRRC